MHAGLSHADVAVIGGGPAGACVAQLLARAGRSVTVLEASSFPRHHVGESLLAMSVPILARCGFDELLGRARFVHKRGAVFVWGDPDAPALDLPMPGYGGSLGTGLAAQLPGPGYALQVQRCLFDALLLDQARRSGATVCFEHKLVGLARAADGWTLLVAHQGQQHRIGARMIVDASGLRRITASLFGRALDGDGPTRQAIYGYFSGSRPLPAPHAGDVLTEAIPQGWLWHIPLADGQASVGFVSDHDLVERPFERAFADAIAASRELRELLRPATQLAELRSCGYRCAIQRAPLWSDDCVVVGDAAMFVDPLFSTGVHAALYTAELAGCALVDVLHDRVSPQVAQHWYDQRVREHHARIRATVDLLHGLHHDESAFWRRRRLQLDADAAERMLRALGVQGLRLFAALSGQRSHVQLPERIAAALPEFHLDLRPRVADDAAVLDWWPGLRPQSDFLPSEHGLVPALRLQRDDARAPMLVRARKTTLGAALELIDGTRSVASIAAAFAEHERDRVRMFLGTLVQAGLAVRTRTEVS